MRCTHWGASCCVEHFTDRPIVWNWVRCWSKPPEVVVSVFIGVQVGTARDATVRVLHIVEAIVISFPHFNTSIWDWVPVGIGDRTFDPAWLSWCSASNVATYGYLCCVLNKERSEYGCFGCIFVCCVIDVDSLHRHSEHIGQQDKFLSFVVGDVTNGGQEFN